MTPQQLLLAVVALIPIGLLCAVALDRMSRRENFVLSGMLLAHGLLSILAGAAVVAAGGRELLEPGTVTGPELMLLRLSTLLSLLVIGVGLLKASALRLGIPRSGGGLWLGAMAFLSATVVTDYVSRQFRLASLVFLFTFATIYFVPRSRPSEVAVAVKWLAAFVIVASLVAAAFLPAAWTPYPTSLLPGIAERLRGIMVHSNQLGPIAVLYILMERVQPGPRHVRIPLMIAAVAVLTLTQSKTSWGAALFALIVQWAWGSKRDAPRRVFALVGFGCAVVALSLFSGFDTSQTLIDDDRINSLTTLTGRTPVWADGLEIWKASPIVGSGPTAFYAYASESGPEWARKAHNQYIQALGTSGILGFAGLILYVSAIVFLAYRLAPTTGWSSVGLAGLLLIHTITESPLDKLDLVHLGTFALLLAWEHDRVTSRSAAITSRAARLGLGGSSWEISTVPYGSSEQRDK